MPEQIVIEFIGDSSKLLPTIELLEKFGQIDAAALEAFKKANVEMAKRPEILKKTAAEAEKQIKTLKDVEKAVDQTADAFIQTFKEEAAGALAGAGMAAEDFSDTTGKAMQDAGKATDANTSSQERLTKKLREMKAEGALVKKELDDMRAAGLQNSKAFQDLEQRYRGIITAAGELQDTIGDVNAEIATAGSDTSGLDKTIRAANLGVAAFTGLQGAASLLGAEEEELQQTMVKLNAAMAILNSLQAIQEELSRQDSLATKGLTAAKALYTVVVGNATGATKAFRIALAATGIGFIVLAIAALVTNFDKVKKVLSDLIPGLNLFEGAWDQLRATVSGVIDSIFASLKTFVKVMVDILAFDFKSAVQDFKEGGKEIAGAFKEGYEQKMREINFERDIKNLLRNIKDIEINIKVNEGTTGRTDFDQRIQKARIEAEKAGKELELFFLKAGRDLSQYTEEQINQFYELQNVITDSGNEILSQQRDRNRQALEDVKSLANARVLSAINGSRAELNAKAAAARAERDLALSETGITEARKAEIQAQYRDQLENLDKETRERGLKDTLASLEAQQVRLEQMGQQGSQQFLEVRKKVIREEAQFQIAEARRRGENTAALNAKLQADLKKADIDFNAARLTNERSLINARLSQSREGSAEELSAKLDGLRNERDQSLNAYGITAQKRKEIEEKYLRDAADLNRQYNLKVQQDAIAIRQSDINSQLADLQRANVEETNSELIDLKKRSIDEQAALDELNARNTITNEELLQARLVEIRRKAIADKQAIDDQAYVARIDQARAIYNAELSNEAKLLQLQLANGSLSLGERKAARERLKQIDRDAIAQEETDIKRKYQNGKLSEEEYQKAMLEIKGKYLDLDLKQTQEKEERKRGFIQAGLQVIQDAFAASFDIENQSRQARVDAELADLDRRKQAELDAKNLTEQQKSDIEKRFKDRERTIRRKAAEDEKQAKINQALINGALAVTNILATAPFYTWPFAIPAAILTTGIQVAKISSTPIPAFAKGTRNAPKGYAWVGEEGPELVELSGGEKIYTYRESMKVSDAWEKGRPGTVEEILAGKLPQAVDPDLISSTYINAAGQLQIDYDAMGKSVAKYMPRPINSHVNIDKNGFRTFIEDQGNRTEILNKRYKLD